MIAANKKTSLPLRGLLAFGVAAAVALLGFNLYMLTVADHANPLEKPLAELAPESFENWTAETFSVSESEEMKARVEGLLKYDDALMRVYRAPGLSVSLYAAYWNAGKIPVHEVGVHTPDSCWVGNGWVCEDRRFACEQTIDGVPLKPFEYGAYKKGDNVEYVIFWHLVGDGVSALNYNGWRNGLVGRLERLPYLFDSFKRFGLQQRREQFFIRISSPIPFEELWRNPDFLALIKQLKSLRIFETSPVSPS